MLIYGQEWPIYAYVCVGRAKKYSVMGRSSYAKLLVGKS